MEIFQWANGQGKTFKLDAIEARLIIQLLENRRKDIELDGITYEVEWVSTYRKERG